MMPLLCLALLFLVLEGFFSGSETGAYRINRIRLRHRVEQGRSDAVRLGQLLRNPRAFVCMTLAGTNLAVYATTAIVTAAVAPFTGRYAELTATLALAPAVLIFAEALPKSLFHAHANSVMYFLSWPLWVAFVLMRPVTWLLQGVTAVSSRLLRAPQERGWELSVQRLFGFLTEGAREGVLSQQQNAMARNVMKLDRIRAEQVMIPIGEVRKAPLDATFEDLRRSLRQHAHSRVPIYDGNPANIVGVVNLIDFLCVEEPSAVADLMRPLPRVAAASSIDEVFLALQSQRQVMAVVEDAEANAVGIVTMKDLVEEVVGDLHEW